jgi:hypothetical protein
MEQHPALLQLVHALTVLEGVEVTQDEDGVHVGTRTHGGLVGWREIDAALGTDDPLDRAPRLRLQLLLALHRVIVGLGDAAAATVRRAARPLALPARHPLHPGRSWVQDAVPGGVLELGVGVCGLRGGRTPVPLPASVAAAAGLDPTAHWDRLLDLGECSGDLAVDRWARAGADPQADVLRNAGGCDALTFLALPGVRGRLAAAGTAGAEPAARFWPHALACSPSREQVWTGRRAADDAYARAVWMLTPAAERGIAVPLLVDAHRVAPAPPAQRSVTRHPEEP